MRCTRPRTVGFYADGKTLCWSPKKYSKEYPTFQLPCGKCISCRLEYARQWAVRCVHESQMHEENCFITLTYSDDHLKSPKLIYEDFQKFMKRLRRAFPNQPIGCFVTGEYGERTKRPHWHALLFGWRPKDATYKYSNERGDRTYDSVTLTRLWGHGIAELGSVTFESAGYCARYAAKKLTHGRDQHHEYHPISKKSSKHAIGKKFLEKFWPDIFNLGAIVLPNGKTCSIPRYYEKWLKTYQPQAWTGYVTQLKQKQLETAISKSEKEQKIEREINNNRNGGKGPTRKKTEAREKIQAQKFKQLQEYLKL